ncbi:hypothetical protein N0O92_12500 [Alkalihalobacillus sp. MEB130]|uniref:hypothetical protein n=1 Tax=Alkalihalobacillus sp. MEB130 TaxID=2976704 RepID=UPI0028DDD278|nr:hypothetical protein [Alkalihalobacillus sp. MEB130]MDT8861055.1 hypothetical protein [Alkalihalobacillus sp. MEB130]
MNVILAVEFATMVFQDVTAVLISVILDTITMTSTDVMTAAAYVIVAEDIIILTAVIAIEDIITPTVPVIATDDSTIETDTTLTLGTEIITA